MSLILIAIPGPSVMFEIARTLAAGIRVGIITVAFNILGVALWMLLVAVGLGELVQTQPVAISAIRIIGAAYLFYIGFRTLLSGRADRANGVELQFTDAGSAQHPFRQVAKEAFLVGVTNPKTAVFFFAVLPQFVDTVGQATNQMLFLGALFLVLGALGDSAYVVVAGLLRAWFASNLRRVRSMQLVGGILICALAVALAFDILRS